MRRDPDNARREFLAEFAEQTSAFFPVDRLAESFTLAGDIPYDARYRYFAGIDQSGLTGRDRFAMAIAHKERDNRVVLDCLRAWDTTDAEHLLREIGELKRDYRLTLASLDRYAGGWVSNALNRVPLMTKVCEPLPQVYTNLKSLIIAGQVELPENGALRTGLLRTQAFYSKSNNLSIAHERTAQGHGDEADAVARAVWLASRKDAWSLSMSDEDERRAEVGRQASQGA